MQVRWNLICFVPTNVLMFVAGYVASSFEILLIRVINRFCVINSRIPPNPKI